MNIILADDNRNLCSALALVLETRLQPVELAFASNFAELLQRVNERQTDCIVLDCELPGFAGCLSQLRSISPDVKIIVFSARPEARLSACLIGADSFVSKTSPPEELLEAIRQVPEITDQVC